MRPNYLFAQVDMFSVTEHQKQQAAKRVQEIDSNYLQRVSEEEVVRQIVNEYRLDVPVINDDKIYVAEHREAQVDVSRDFNRHISDRSRPFYVNGIKTTIAVPFEGDAELFKVQPNTYTTTRPAADIVGNEIRLTYSQAEPNAEAIKNAYTKTVQEIKQYLDWQRPSAEEFNGQLEALVRQRVSDRKNKLSAGAGLIDSLGLPTKKPGD
ncbi:MAG: hypothetical protein JOZ02_00180 [Acidobacteria bacterium]|nr:hypothetical protein [Acidobacteriota bacterium]